MTDSRYPEGLRYHPEHDWARQRDNVALLGITWYAQEALGDIVFVELPGIGANIAKGEPYAEVESVKAVSDVVAPVSGEVTAVNAALIDAPEILNTDPYGEGWLIEVRLVDPGQLNDLLDAAAYQELTR